MLMFGGIIRQIMPNSIKDDKEDTYVVDVWRLRQNKWKLDGFLNKVKIAALIKQKYSFLAREFWISDKNWQEHFRRLWKRRLRTDKFSDRKSCLE